MLIVSQNGTVIANTDTMQGITVQDGTLEIWHDNKTHNVLGTYSKDKALEVKENLLGAYMGTTRNTIFYMPENY